MSRYLYPNTGTSLPTKTMYSPCVTTLVPGSALAEINYPAIPLSYNFNNIGKYMDFFAYYPYYDGFRTIIWKNIWVIHITIRVI